MKSSANKKILYLIFTFLGIAFLFLLYEISFLLVNNSNILPSLNDIFHNFFNLLKNINLFRNIAFSFLRTLLSIVIAFGIGVLTGCLSGLFPKFNYFIKPLISLCKCIPVPCFIYLLFIFFLNNKNIAVIIVVFLIIFPIIHENSKSGIININQNIIDSLKIEGLYRKNSIFKVLLIEALPYILSGLISSIGLALKVEVTAEILLGPHNIIGIGRNIFLAKEDLDFATLYALIILIILIFIILDFLCLILKKIIKNKF